MDTLSERIIFIRKHLGYNTQNEFAEFVGIERTTISKIENGTSVGITKSNANLIEAKTGFSAEWIKTGKGPMKIEKPEIKDAESEEDEFLKELTIDDRDLFEGVVKEFKDLTDKDKENIREVIRLAKKQIERFKKEEEEEGDKRKR
jgi:transcriptional regulator with XRE-family HTH domain